jgi:hypothetical protein
MVRNRAHRALKCIFLAFIVSMCPLFVFAQSGDGTVSALVDLGFENVSWAENESERVYVIENTAYRVSGVGIGVALDEIRKHGLPEVGKVCRLIVLDNNVPMVSLSCKVMPNREIARKDWNASYDLDGSWELVKGEKRHNSSLFKTDLLVYPEFSFRNSRLTVPYEIKLNMNPTLQVSLWRGGKLNAQLIIPVVNDYGYKYDDVRPGYLTLEHTVRLPYNVFLTGIVGLFNNNRSGVDLSAQWHPSGKRFWFDGRVSWTVFGEWGEWEYHNGIQNISPFKYGYSLEKKKITGQLGVNYYWERFNTQLSGRAESFLEGDCGVTFEMIRHCRNCSIGFYGMYVPSDWWNSGVNGGFRFQIALPPYKYKRRGYVPRVMPSGNFGFSYNAGGTFVSGQRFRADIDDNISDNIQFNPSYIKQELLNF